MKTQDSEQVGMTFETDRDSVTLASNAAPSIVSTSASGVDLGKATAEVFIKQQCNLMVAPADCDVPANTGGTLPA